MKLRTTVQRDVAASRDEQGLAIIMTVIVVAVLSGIMFGVTIISIRQVAIATDLKDSAAAVVAADAGAEEALYEFWRVGSEAVCEDPQAACVATATLSNGASYTVTYDFSNDAVTEDAERWINSVGVSGGIRRAFELSGF